MRQAVSATRGQVLVEDGRVVERGSPSRLWETEGPFKKLFRDANYPT